MNCHSCQAVIDYGRYVRCLQCGQSLCGLTCLLNHGHVHHPDNPYVRYEPIERSSLKTRAALVALLALFGAATLLLIAFPQGRP